MISRASLVPSNACFVRGFRFAFPFAPHSLLKALPLASGVFLPNALPSASDKPPRAKALPFPLLAIPPPLLLITPLPLPLPNFP